MKYADLLQIVRKEDPDILGMQIVKEADRHGIPNAVQGEDFEHLCNVVKELHLDSEYSVADIFVFLNNKLCRDGDITYKNYDQLYKEIKEEIL